MRHSKDKEGDVMASTMNVIAGLLMIALCAWWYTQYRKDATFFAKDDMWKSSQVLSVLSIMMIVFVYILVQVSHL